MYIYVSFFVENIWAWMIRLILDSIWWIDLLSLYHIIAVSPCQHRDCFVLKLHNLYKE